MSDPSRVEIYTIPSHRSFADALAQGVMHMFSTDPLGLARGRILLPNHRAVRAVTDAFVRRSGNGLLLPRLIPVGDVEIDDRLGQGLESVTSDCFLPALDPTERQMELASLIKAEGAAERMRLAADLARVLDALLIDEIAPLELRNAVEGAQDLAQHWEHSLRLLELIYEEWPKILRESGVIDLAARRNLVLRSLSERWENHPPAGFTIAAGITSSAPAVAGLIGMIARMPRGMVVLPGLWLSDMFPNEEWDSLGPDDRGRTEATHPQFHLRLLLDCIGIARDEVRPWRWSGSSPGSPSRFRAVANAMASSSQSHKWETLSPPERRLNGIRLVELADPAAEAQAIALALRKSLETPGKTAALVTPDRQLAGRVSALLRRWNIEADDSAGQKLSDASSGTLLLAIASVAADDFSPVSLLALLKHPLVGGEEEDRAAWLENVRALDHALRGPRPPSGLGGLDRLFADRKADKAWTAVRDKVCSLEDAFSRPLFLSDFALILATAADRLGSEAPWRGAAGRLASELLSDLEVSKAARKLEVTAQDCVPILRQLLEARAVRPPYGGHPRIFIWGLLEARLQRADLLVLGGLNEGIWPGRPQPDPWLPPRVRSNLGMPTLEFRIGLAAHDFATALGAPEVLITRSKRDTRSPTIASRFLLRLEAISGGLPRDLMLERLTNALDDPLRLDPVNQPAPSPPLNERPKTISVTSVDRLKADPFAFYANAILKLREEEPVDADFTARWKGEAVHKVFEEWLIHDDCDPAKLHERAKKLLAGEAIHPMLRALWSPRLFEAIEWIAEMERTNQALGRRPLAAEIKGEAEIAGILVHGRADRIDLIDGKGLALVDYKTGKPPSRKAVQAGFALQLGLLGLIASAGGFKGIEGQPQMFEYWSLGRDRETFGKCVRADKDIEPKEFLNHAYGHFADAAERWLRGTEPFTAKLNPAYAPYGDYDQLMRLEEWYGRK